MTDLRGLQCVRQKEDDDDQQHEPDEQDAEQEPKRVS